jgi:hypothetical protein
VAFLDELCCRLEADAKPSWAGCVTNYGSALRGQLSLASNASKLSAPQADDGPVIGYGIAGKTLAVRLGNPCVSWVVEENSRPPGPTTMGTTAPVLAILLALLLILSVASRWFLK